jgi:hypothetical protein
MTVELVSNLVNAAFGWIIVALSAAGYFLTIKRTGEKWLFWIVLGTGWGFFAVSQTFILAGANRGALYLAVLLMASFILVVYALVLLFLKLVKVR